MGREFVTTWWDKVDSPDRADISLYDRQYRNNETGEVLAYRDLPIGALIYFETTYAAGPDGLSVRCKMPSDRWWTIDGAASNCAMPTDEVHRCWCRHGTVGDRLTVNKVGNTCNAGAGSIAMPDFHGFLTNGILREC